jgi:hypothetical protein
MIRNVNHKKADTVSSICSRQYRSFRIEGPVSLPLEATVLLRPSMRRAFSSRSADSTFSVSDSIFSEQVNIKEARNTPSRHKGEGVSPPYRQWSSNKFPWRVERNNPDRVSLGMLSFMLPLGFPLRKIFDRFIKMAETGKGSPILVWCATCIMCPVPRKKTSKTLMSSCFLERCSIFKQ